MITAILYKAVLLLTAPFFIQLISPDISSVSSLWIFFLNMYLYLLCIFIMNDYADRFQDRAARKHRAFGLLPTPITFGIILIVLSANVIIGYVLSQKILYLLVLIVGLIAGFAYSVRPLRIKERGGWGIIFTGIPGRVAPIAMACILYKTIGWWVLILVTAEWIKTAVNILFHQIVDYEADLSTQTKTFVFRRGKEEAARLLRQCSYVGVAASLVAGSMFAVYIPEYRWVFAFILLMYFPAMIAAPYVLDGEKRSLVTRFIPFSYMWFGYTVFFLSPMFLSAIATIRNWEFLLISFFLLLIMLFQTRFYFRYRYE